MGMNRDAPPIMQSIPVVDTFIATRDINQYKVRFIAKSKVYR
jgi:hypothetical protein